MQRRHCAQALDKSVLLSEIKHLIEPLRRTTGKRELFLQPLPVGLTDAHLVFQLADRDDEINRVWQEKARLNDRQSLFIKKSEIANPVSPAS
jgi:hypothetical protein